MTLAFAPNIPPRLLHALQEELPQKFPVRKIWLFGSRARGDHMSYADVDLAFDIADFKGWDWLDMVEMVDHETLLKVDCVDLGSAPADLKENIFRDGIVIYARP